MDGYNLHGNKVVDVGYVELVDRRKDVKQVEAMLIDPVYYVAPLSNQVGVTSDIGGYGDEKRLDGYQDAKATHLIRLIDSWTSIRGDGRLGLDKSKYPNLELPRGWTRKVTATTKTNNDHGKVRQQVVKWTLE
ncbi:hypothetical protein KEM56_004050 [Ascosphaera pollenicola]|nr:hypothetical protein KEM56_004050 [Ascosphaera pollenicola]